MAQNTEVKINAVAGALAVFNPSIEVALGKQSSLSVDYMGIYAEESYLYTGFPLLYTMTMFEYRQYFKEEKNYKGFFAGGDFGLNMFRMNKNVIPLVMHDSGSREYDVGYGYFLGFTVGYKYPIATRWSIEASISGGWSLTQHEGYNFEGERTFDLNPSAEWLLYKAGIYVSYRL